MPFDSWRPALKTEQIGDPADCEPPSLTWVAVDDDGDDPDALDREPRGADDETVAAAVASNDHDRCGRGRPDKVQQADDEAVAEAIARVDAGSTSSHPDSHGRANRVASDEADTPDDR